MTEILTLELLELLTKDKNILYWINIFSFRLKFSPTNYKITYSLKVTNENCSSILYSSTHIQMFYYLLWITIILLLKYLIDNKTCNQVVTSLHIVSMKSNWLSSPPDKPDNKRQNRFAYFNRNRTEKLCSEPCVETCYYHDSWLGSGQQGESSISYTLSNVWNKTQNDDNLCYVTGTLAVRDA